jgi:hypothetical protein
MMNHQRDGARIYFTPCSRLGLLSLFKSKLNSLLAAGLPQAMGLAICH